ncbi:MAG: DUF2970 domain-containing protein [Gammaproteobacteria bacterium]|nr:DUF2970 domain-containing protein [Gammaproteobacteria bacterium]
MTETTDKTPPTFMQTFKSSLAAMFGVQSSAAHERDFTRGKPSHFIFMGIILTTLFVLTVWGVVKLVLSAAGV